MGAPPAGMMALVLAVTSRPLLMLTLKMCRSLALALMPGVPFLPFLSSLRTTPRRQLRRACNLPCSLHHAMQQVQSARHQASRQWFPRLTPASHQHLSGCGIVLAHPQWEPSGVIILIENGLDAGRLFAAVAPPLAQRHSVAGAYRCSGY